MTEPAPQTEQPKGKLNLAERIRARVAPFGGVDLELPPRESARKPPDFSGFDPTLAEVRAGFADMSPDAVDALIDEAVTEIREKACTEPSS